MTYLEMAARDAAMAEYGLPPLPDDYDGEGARALILFRFKLGPVLLSAGVSLDDAIEYTGLDATEGSDFFVGRDLAENWS